jgi:hypothetical protein
MILRWSSEMNFSDFWSVLKMNFSRPIKMNLGRPDVLSFFFEFWSADKNEFRSPDILSFFSKKMSNRRTVENSIYFSDDMSKKKSHSQANITKL